MLPLKYINKYAFPKGCSCAFEEYWFYLNTDLLTKVVIIIIILLQSNL